MNAETSFGRALLFTVLMVVALVKRLVEAHPNMIIAAAGVLGLGMIIRWIFRERS